jgi:hypothetical protein
VSGKNYLINFDQNIQFFNMDFLISASPNYVNRTKFELKRLRKATKILLEGHIIYEQVIADLTKNQEPKEQ